MRVLHIGKFFPPYAGGIERSSADLTAALVERGVAVTMLAHASPVDGAAKHFQAAGVDVTLAACHGQWLYAPVSPSFVFVLNRLIREFKPDLLHLHVPNTSAFWALLSPAARRLPWIVHWHADVPHDIRRSAVRAMYRLYRPWEQALLRRANAVIATSPPYRDASSALAPWRDKIEVIPLGLAAQAHAVDDSVDSAPARSNYAHPEKVDAAANVASSTNTQWPGNGLRVLAVGRLSHYKGFDVLLRALAQVTGASLVLIGSGECDNDLRTLAHELGLQTRVRFAGHVDDATLAQAYAQAQAFCLPSVERSEAFGMVLLEAMRARLAVIASAIPGSGVGYVVVDDVSGLLVAPGDAAALAQALRRLAGDSGLRTQLGAAGHARWQSEFSLDRCADRTLALYRSVLEAAERRAAT
jgi:glycosyltransferase involved in cell wall biosynthesis